MSKLILTTLTWTALVFPSLSQATSPFWKVGNMDCEVRRPDTGYWISMSRTHRVHWYGQCLFGKAYGMGLLEYFKEDNELLATYQGEMKHGDANGKGKFIVRDFSYDGLSYKGQFRNNQFHGLGTLMAIGHAIYTGQFENDRYHGKGNLEHYDGVRYEGQFKNGLYSGRGTLHIPTGMKYTGQFRDNKLNGEITVTDHSMNYAGQVLDAKSSGKVIKPPPDGFVYTKYIGQFRDDKPVGRGAYFLSNGDKHLGPWDHRCINSNREIKCANLVRSD